MRRFLSVLSCLLLPALASAQPSARTPEVGGPPPPPEVAAFRARGPIRIDGRLDEVDWPRAEAATRFTQTDPEEGQPASEPTEVRVLFDDQALYVGARLFDHDPGGIRARLARRDDGSDSDLFQVSFDSFHDRLTAWTFQVNPAGAIRDAAVYADGSEDDSWDGVWDAAARVDSAGWTAELRIPFSQLHYNGGGAGVWGVQFYRLIQRRQENAWFAFTPKSEAGGVSRYGNLTGLHDLPTGRHLEVLPYTIGRAEYAPGDPGNPFRTGHDYSGSLGLDVRYGLTPDLTLSGAVNPDFGQAEVDPAVVNLSAFETFYPEKRPFFVSDAGHFAFGSVRSMNNFGFGQTFYSRRIGRPPHRQLTGDFRYLDEPAEGTIAGAVKLTGKTGSGWTVGLLEALTTSETARYVTLDDRRGRAEVEPLTNNLVGRLRRDLRGGNSQVGVLLTGVQRDLADSTLRATLHSSAITAGFDWNHAWSRRAWSFDGFLLGSRVSGSPAAVAATQRRSGHYFQRPDADHLTFDPARTALSGYHGTMALARNNGRHWRGSLMTQFMSPGYEVNDLGFMNRADRYTVTTIVMYTENEPKRFLRNWNAYPFTYHAWNWDHQMITSGFAFGWSGQLTSYWNVDGQLRYSPSTLDDRLTRGGPLARTPEGRQAQLTITSDSRRPWTVTTSGVWYDNPHGGFDRTWALGLNLHPSPGLRLEVGPAWEHSTDTGQYVLARPDPTAGATGGTRYLFAALEQHQVSLETRLNWVFSPKVSLQLYAQPLIVTGRYRDFSELHAPRTFDFDVYGRDTGSLARDHDGLYTVDPDGAGPAAPFTFGDPDFNFRSLRGNAVLRWEYRPGSTFYLIWQQDRSDTGPEGDFRFTRDVSALGRAPASHIVMIKLSTWLGW